MTVVYENADGKGRLKPMHLFERPFRTKVLEGWRMFFEKEEKLRKLIDERAGWEMIAKYLEYLLSPVFEEVYAEVGFNEGKYELMLNLDGDWSRLFSLAYFREHAPEEISLNWNIYVGRQMRGAGLMDCGIRINGIDVQARDIQVWTEWAEETVKVYIYCEKLVPVLRDTEGDAYWIAYTMLDYAVGELAEMEYVDEVEILDAPRSGKSMTLADLLPQFMEKLALSKEELFDAGRYCQLYTGYQMNPDEEGNKGLRKDVFIGSSCFMPLLNEFFNGESEIMDHFHEDGIAAGYFCYPLAGFEGDDKSGKILDFRDSIANQVEETAGAGSFSYIGGASGIYYGYLDFIAWDLKAVLDAAAEIFEKSGIEWAAYHSFRQDAGGVMLYKAE